jgi:CheY-like chemotaxis protein
VILTVSGAEQDLLRAHQLDARAYITRPVDLQQFISVIEDIDEFALLISLFPGELEQAV